MSTDPRSDPQPTAPASGPPEAGERSPADDARSAGSKEPTEASGAAATFDPHCTRRLPNTVDRENEHVG